jgi:hypothetical protein
VEAESVAIRPDVGTDPPGRDLLECETHPRWAGSRLALPILSMKIVRFTAILWAGWSLAMTPLAFPRLRIVLQVVLMTAYVAAANADTDPVPRAIYPLEVIRAAVAESRQRLKSLQIEYTIKDVDPKAPELRGAFVRQAVIVAGVRRLIDTRHGTALFPMHMDINHVLSFYDGSRLVLLKPDQGYCETTSQTASQSVWSVRCEYILECTGWWPPGDDTKTPYSANGPFLHEVLADPQCCVLPDQEVVDGACCHVIERPGVDRLWFDPSIGFSLRRRWRYRGNPSVRAVDYELSDYGEVAPGAWFPRRLRRIIYGTATAAAGRTGPVESDCTGVVNRIAVNRDFGAEVALAIPPGTFVVDFDTGESSKVPGSDLSRLDRLIELGGARGAVYAQLGLAPGWPSSKVSRYIYILSSSAGVFALVLAGLGAAFLLAGGARERHRVGQQPGSAGWRGDEVTGAIPAGGFPQ